MKIALAVLVFLSGCAAPRAQKISQGCYGLTGREYQICLDTLDFRFEK